MNIDSLAGSPVRKTNARGDRSMRNIVKLVPLAAVIAGLILSTTASAAVNLSCAAQNFDTTATPSLPGGWTSNVDKGAPTTRAFITRAVGYSDSGTSTAFVDDTNDYADVSLYSAVLGVVDTGVTPSISFRHSYVLWAPDAGPNYNGAYDGGVLEVSVNGGDFTDITAAGGAITSGGYNTFLDSQFDNPIAQPPLSPGRSVWSGDSGGFKTVNVRIPTTAFNGTVQLRWRLGTEGGGRAHDTHAGWWIDSFQYSALGDVIFRDGFDGACP
jgi:hypothetical protein